MKKQEKKPANSWAVMKRAKNTEGRNKEWETESWYPSVIIDTINGSKLEKHSEIDMGEIKAAHRAFVKAKKYPNLEYTIEKVYFGNHNENKMWDYTGEQRRVLE